VRFVYMDEAGISSREPIVLVVAIIVDADRRWKRLESRIHEIAAERGVDPEQIVFHAKDLFHGTGLFPRDKWPVCTKNSDSGVVVMQSTEESM
jgi:hypothetical protein